MKWLALFFLCSNLFAAELKPYTVYLKQGAHLVGLEDKKDVIISKGIYAQVLELDPKKRTQFWVFNKNNQKQYLVEAEDIVEIEDDIRILPNVDAEKIYPPKSVFKAENKFALLDTQIGLHFDSIGLTPLNTIYSDEIASVMAARYEIRTLYVSDLPVEFGLSLNYQSAYWKNDFEEVRISILSFGPHFKYNFFNADNLKINGVAGAEIAPIYQGKTELYTDDYSAMLFDVGLESDWKTDYGTFTLGSHIRHHNIALSKSTRPNPNISAKEFSLNSVGVLLGYKIEWDL